MKYNFEKFIAKRKRQNIPWHRKKNPEMAFLRDKGWTYQQIANKYNLSRQRVHKILTG